MSNIRTLQDSSTDNEPSRVGFFVGHCIVVRRKRKESQVPKCQSRDVAGMLQGTVDRAKPRSGDSTVASGSDFR